jgi:heme/copper-type cytochrome/quinol oxidase subunit 2
MVEPSIEVAIIIFAVVAFHYLIFYFLTRKRKNIEGKQIEYNYKLKTFN